MKVYNAALAYSGIIAAAFNLAVAQLAESPSSPAASSGVSAESLSSGSDVMGSSSGSSGSTGTGTGSATGTGSGTSPTGTGSDTSSSTSDEKSTTSSSTSSHTSGANGRFSVFAGGSSATYGATAALIAVMAAASYY
ncbi:hypothetical protein GGI11_002857 [Coemansia sp. RSA 2049]|nr:hypothetical protein GGI11_002857 [Coemansia sp. RSA 2049]